MQKIIILLLQCLFLIQMNAQNYQNAESAEYDAVNSRWLVSNGNNIIADDGQGNRSFFGNVSAGYGMEILGNVLFAIDNNVIRGYDLTTAMEVASLSIPGVVFLNGMANDGTSTIFVTDFSGNKIYSIDVSDLNNLTYETLVNNTVSKPNGIIYDGENNRLLFVNWSSNAAVKAVDLTDNSVSTVVNTGLGNIDGIDEDNEGNYYLASWSPAQISKYDKNFDNPLEIISTPFISQPADIGYSLQTDTLAIPIGNNVVFVDLGGAPNSVEGDLDIAALQLNIYPNPVSEASYFQFELTKSNMVQLDIVNQNGQIIRNLLRTHQAAGIHKILLAGHDLPAGIYFGRLTIGGEVVTKEFVVSK